MVIFDANRDQLKDPDKIQPGQVLKIPQAARK
jgi:nucleoid-associated protein YgaU